MAAAGKDVSKQRSKQMDELSKEEAAALRREAPNPVWFKPLMFGFMLLGLIWIVVYYITSTTATPLPIPALGQGNIFVGFGLVLVGFMMTPWWK
ncbi:MAG: cell division protein CrgA [Leucobacter sp.]|nr:cell division protein CrgA [Leucobacter sp.]